MPHYIRKIDKAKWAKTDARTSDVAADAITNCLHTRSNQLSFWKVEPFNDNNLKEVLKAIISTFTSGIDTFDVVFFDENEMPDDIKSIQSKAVTPYTAMIDNHYDLVDLTISKLTSLSGVIYSKIKIGAEKRITRTEAKNLMREVIAADPTFRGKLHSTIADSL